MKCSQLCNLMWDFENEINKQVKRGRIKYILMNPKEFSELRDDKKSSSFLTIEEDTIKFMGVPIIRTTEIEFVDFCI